MSITLDYSRALISEGDPKHIHYWIVKKEGNKHQIGKCQCGRIVDFTDLQMQLPIFNCEKVEDKFMDKVIQDYRKRPEKNKRMVNQ